MFQSSTVRRTSVSITSGCRAISSFARACAPTQTTDNQLDMALAEGLYGRADLLGDFLHIPPGHFQLRMPKLRLDVSRIAVLLEMGRACPTKRLVGHVRDTGAFRQWL